MTAASAARKSDPNNELLWRCSRKRLTAEQLRDAILATSGELNEKRGGESVRPELPEGISAAYAWKPTADARERNRRSIYLFVRRNLREPLLESLDMPDTTKLRPPAGDHHRAAGAGAAQRPLDTRSFAGLAGRVLAEAVADGSVTKSTGKPLIRRAYSIVSARTHDDKKATASKNSRRESQTHCRSGWQTRRVVGGVSHGAGKSLMPPGGGVVDFCHVLLNSNEFRI